MVQEENSQRLEVVHEQVLTPEVFSPRWSSDPVNSLDIPLNFPYSLEEWDKIFATFTQLLDHKERHVWDTAIRRLIYALEMEESQHSSCDDYKPRPTHERLRNLFEAIVAQTSQKPEIFEIFCSRLKFLAEKAPYQHLVLEWLNQLAALDDRQAPTQEAIVAAQLFLGAYDSTWQEVGTTLLEMLDHSDLTVRACAAYQIGKFCKKAISSKDKVWEWNDDEKYKQDKQSVVGMPSFEVLMQLIRTKELERPGVAGAFWDVVPKAGFDVKEWLLNILENSPEPEPYIPYFPCSLGFDAHERFSRDANAVRRLIDIGRVDIALAAATDEPRKIAALEPLLIELGRYDDPEIVRIASWHLAYYYHYLHPRGAELGYVELVSELSEVDLFLLFSQKSIEPPYAVVIYPKGIQKFSRAVAQRWVDQIFPAEVRGKPREDLPSLISHWYQRGYIDYHLSAQNTKLLTDSPCSRYIDYYLSAQNTKSDLIDNVIIEYRSTFPWNPKQFL